MAVRASRLLSTLTAGGVLAGSLLFVTGAAEAAPRPPGGGTVPATCGQTVTAYPGDRVKVTPRIGIPFIQTVTPGMGPVAMTVSGLLCSVQVKVLKPAAAGLTRVAPPLGSTATTLTEGSAKILAPESQAPSLAPAPRAAAPAAPVPMRVPGRAPVSTLPGQAPLSTLPAGGVPADASLLAPASAFAATDPSTLPATSAGLPAAGAAGLDGSSLFGSAFPGLRAGAPAFLGYDPTSAVTTASQVQALPVDGLSDGVGLPAILAVLGLSGAAAYAVRRLVLGRSLLPAGLAGGAAPLAAGSSVPAAPAAPAVPVTPAEQTALVAPVEGPAERTALVAPVEEPAERTALVAPVEEPAEATAVTPPVSDDEPATEFTAQDSAEVAALTAAADDEADDEADEAGTTSVLAATGGR